MSPTLIWPYQVHWSWHRFTKKNRLTNLSKLPTPITRSWEFTIPIPHWVLHFFHIEEGLLITFHITISAHWTEEEFNSFTVRIFFRWRTERSIPPHLIKESRIVLGYQWPNRYYQIEEDLIVHTPSRGSSVTGVKNIRNHYTSRSAIRRRRTTSRNPTPTWPTSQTTWTPQCFWYQLENQGASSVNRSS